MIITADGLSTRVFSPPDSQIPPTLALPKGVTCVRVEHDSRMNREGRAGVLGQVLKGLAGQGNILVLPITGNERICREASLRGEQFVFLPIAAGNELSRVAILDTGNGSLVYQDVLATMDLGV